MAKYKPLSHAKPLPSCPCFMVNITFGAVCCCMYNHLLDIGINPPPHFLPFKVLEISIDKPPPQKSHKTSTTDYTPILLLPVTEQPQVKIWRQAFYILNHDKSQMEVLSKSNVKLLLWLPEFYIHFTIKPAMICSAHFIFLHLCWFYGTQGELQM
jgi:hypothetical protein